MSSIEDHARWFELSDGTLSYKATIYEALNYTQNCEVLGGFSTIRMMDGTGIKQSQWQKLRISISGSGGIPPGITDLDYTKVITLKCGAPRAITRATNSFTVIPPHRTDTGYTPIVFKLVEGFWVSLDATGTGTKFLMIYYPQINAIVNPPQESYTWDGASPSSWSIIAEEI